MERTARQSTSRPADLGIAVLAGLPGLVAAFGSPGTVRVVLGGLGLVLGLSVLAFVVAAKRDARVTPKLLSVVVVAAIAFTAARGIVAVRSGIA